MLITNAIKINNEKGGKKYKKSFFFVKPAIKLITVERTLNEIRCVWWWNEECRMNILFYAHMHHNCLIK